MVARGSDVEATDEEIYTKLKDDLVRYATVLVGPDRADDVLSTVMVRLLRRRRLASLDDPRPYLFRAVLNECRGVLRRRPAGAVPPLPHPDGIPEPDWAVIEAVASLPGRQRAAIFLRYWEDLPLAEIASLMGSRPGTVKRYLHIAHRRLKDVLE